MLAGYLIRHAVGTLSWTGNGIGKTSTGARGSATTTRHRNNEKSNLDVGEEPGSSSGELVCRAGFHFPCWGASFVLALSPPPLVDGFADVVPDP